MPATKPSIAVRRATIRRTTTPPTSCARPAAVAADPDSLGIVIGGSGNGEQIAANKVRGIRAAVAWTDETARLARLHNDANVLSLGARMYPIADALGFAQIFLETAFSGNRATPAASR